MDILEKIKNSKIEEVRDRKSLYPVPILEKSPYFIAECVSFSEYIKRSDKSGVIAEFKRKSPSEGFINQYASVEEISIGYMQSGASGLSVLTDENYFGGSSKDLSAARECNFCPILRKDFIVDEYQIIEARSIGADVILLIAEILTKEQIASLSKTARALGMEVLMELHSEDQIDKISDSINVVGVNNRNLKDFSVDIAYSLNIFDQIPKDKVKISESGIKNADDMVTLHKKGYDGFLIGTQFMKSEDPIKSCRKLIEEFEEKKD